MPPYDFILIKQQKPCLSFVFEGFRDLRFVALDFFGELWLYAMPKETVHLFGLIPCPIVGSSPHNHTATRAAALSSNRTPGVFALPGHKTLITQLSVN